MTWEEGVTKPDENPPDFASGVRFERRPYGGSTKTWTAEIKQVCLAWTNAASTASMRFPVSIPYVLEHVINGIIVDTVEGELTLEPGLEHSGVVTLAAEVQNGGTEEYVLRLLPVEIVPDPSMYDSGDAPIAPPLFLSVAAAITDISTPGAGRIGDLIPSVNENGEKHFVSPRWTQEIDGDKDKEVILDAAGLTKADFSSTDGKFEWHVEPTTAGQPDPQDASKFQVKRDAVGHAVVSIRQKGQTADVVKMNVWIVWCDSKATYTIPAQNPKVTNDPQIGPVTTIGGGGFIFTHTIQPGEIITAQERPKLEGAKVRADGPPPKDGTHLLFTSEKLADGANNKWDASRQMRFKHANPNALPAHAFSQPAPLITVPDFPTSPVEGNDDSSTPDEVPRPNGVASGNANDPYQDTSQKILWSMDAPGFSISKGNVGDTYEFHIQLREFPRVELNGKWYRIGDYKSWRKRVFMKKIHDAQRNIEYWTIDPDQQSVIKQDLDDF